MFMFALMCSLQKSICKRTKNSKFASFYTRQKMQREFKDAKANSRDAKIRFFKFLLTV